MPQVHMVQQALVLSRNMSRSARQRGKAVQTAATWREGNARAAVKKAGKAAGSAKEQV